MKMKRDESFDEYSGQDSDSNKDDKTGSLQRKPAAKLMLSHKNKGKKRDKSVKLMGVRNILGNRQ